MDSILKQFTKGAVRAIGYADDIVLCLYTSGFDHFTIANLMTDALRSVWEWGQKHGLIFNPTKTVVCRFYTSRKCKSEPAVYMEGKQLANQDRVKYLGITLDKRLTWSKHVNERINKCSYLLNKMSRIVGREWGFTPAKIKWVYTAIIKPKLLYGSVV